MSNAAWQLALPAALFAIASIPAGALVNSNQVIAIATCVQAAGVLGALLYAQRQIADVREGRDEQSRAYLVAYIDFPADRTQFPELVLENVGRTAAYEVTLTTEPTLRSSVAPEYPISNVGWVHDGVRTMAPGVRLATLFDNLQSRPPDWEKRYAAILRYQDRKGCPHQEDFVLDLDAQRGSLSVTRHGLHDIHDELERLRKVFENVSRGWPNPVPILTQSREDYQAAREQELEGMRHMRAASPTMQAVEAQGTPTIPAQDD